jgi:hypothetical protein
VLHVSESSDCHGVFDLRGRWDPSFTIYKKLVRDDGGAAAAPGLVADLFWCMVSNELF